MREAPNFPGDDDASSLDAEMAAFRTTNEKLAEQAAYDAVRARRAAAAASDAETIARAETIRAEHDIQHNAARERAYNDAYFDALATAPRSTAAPGSEGLPEQAGPDLFTARAEAAGEHAARKVDEARRRAEAHAERELNFEAALKNDDWETVVQVLDEAHAAAEASGDWSEFDGYYKSQLRSKEREAYMTHRNMAVPVTEEAGPVTPVASESGTEQEENPETLAAEPPLDRPVFGPVPADEEEADLPPENPPADRVYASPSTVPPPRRHAEPVPPPPTGEALQSRIAGMEASLVRLALAKKAVESGVGRGRSKKLKELEGALAEVRSNIANQDISDAEKIELKFAALQRTAEIQVGASSKPKRIHQLLQRLGGSRVMRAFQEHRRSVYAAAAAVAIGMAAATIASGGAAAAAAIGIGALKGGVLGTLTGGGMGAYGAQTARKLEHTADRTRIRAGAQLESLRARTGERYEDYARRIGTSVLGEAEAMYDQNTARRRHVVARAAGSGALGGAVAGAISSSLHVAHALNSVRVVHEPPAPPPTPQQIHNGIQHILDTNPNRLHQVSGLERLNTNFSELSQHAAATHRGEHLWAAVQHGQGVEHLSNASTQHEILDGMSRLHDAGFQITPHGSIHWNPSAHHYEITGNNWSFGDNAVHAPQGGVNIVGLDGNPHLFTGALNTGQQAAALDLVQQNGAQVLNHDQLVNYLSSHVNPGAHLPGTEAAPRTAIVPRGVHNGVSNVLLNPDSAIDVAAAAVAATPEAVDTSPTKDQARFYWEYDRRLQHLGSQHELDEAAAAAAREGELQQTAQRNSGLLRRMGAHAWATLVTQISVRANLDRSVVRRILRIRPGVHRGRLNIKRVRYG